MLQEAWFLSLSLLWFTVWHFCLTSCTLTTSWVKIYTKTAARDNLPGEDITRTTADKMNYSEVRKSFAAPFESALQLGSRLSLLL